MNFRTTLILFVLVVAGLIFFIVANRSGSTATDDNADAVASGPNEARKLLDLKSEDVTKLVVRPAEGQPLELVKADGAKPATPASPLAMAPGAGPDWKIVQPAAWAADSFDARGFVDSVVNLRSRGRVEAKADRAAFGLDKPRFTIEITDKNNKTTKLLVGNQMALGNDVYVDTGDGRGVSMAAAGTLADKLEKGTQKLFEELRDKRLVAGATAADVKQVELTPRKGEKLVLRKEGVDWKVTSPKQVAADAGEVSSLISELTGLRAEEFVKADSPEASGAMVDQPRLTVWFSREAPATQPSTAPATGPATGPVTRPAGTTVAFGQYASIERDKVYVKVSPEPDVVAKVALSEAAWERLAGASPVTLRDRKVLDLDPERVEKIALTIDRAATTQPTARPAEKREVVLERRREVLQQGPPAPAPAPAKPGDKTSDAGTNAEIEGEAVLAAQEVKAESAAPADASAAKGQAPTGPAPAAEPAAARAKAPAAPAPAATAPAKTTTAPATTTAPTTTTAPSTAPAEPLSKWTYVAGDKKGDADDTKVQSLLDGLHPLRANKYLASSPSAAATGTCVLKVHTTAYGDQPAKVHELKLTETGTGTDAKVVGQYQDLTFEVDRFFLDRVTADFTKKSEPAAPLTPLSAAQ